jgi:hypothetical protein
MRSLILAFAIGLILAASVQAAPIAPKALDPAAYLLDQEWAPLSNDLPSLSLVDPPPVELVSGRCGWGWHHVHWQDHWGHWHWHCVPYVHVYHQWHGTRLEHPYADWRGPNGGWGNP